jgi:hypothetical protein
MPYPYPGDEYRVVEVQVQNLLGPDLLVTSLSLEDVMSAVSASSPVERDIVISSIAIKQLDTAIRQKDHVEFVRDDAVGTESRGMRLRRREIENERCRLLTENRIQQYKEQQEQVAWVEQYTKQQADAFSDYIRSSDISGRGFALQNDIARRNTANGLTNFYSDIDDTMPESFAPAPEPTIPEVEHLNTRKMRI